MSAKLAVRDAADVASRLVAAGMGGSSTPSLSQFLEILRRFERIEFDVPDHRDADGLVCQMCQVRRNSEPTLALGVTGQLETVDAEGEQESYPQVDLEFRYLLAPDLEAPWTTSRSGGSVGRVTTSPRGSKRSHVMRSGSAWSASLCASS